MNLLMCVLRTHTNGIHFKIYKFKDIEYTNRK